MLNQIPSRQQDKCTCKCCGNGIIATILLNVLVWIAIAMSGGAVLDCHMVEADIYSKDGNWPAIPDGLVGLTDGQPTDRRGFGFFIHEDDNGDCRWEYWDKDDSEQDEIEDYIEDYFDWMGKDWKRAAGVSISASALGFVLAVAVVIYGCVTHFWWIRYLTGALAILLVMPLQFGALSVLDSDFCKERNCELKRSAHFAIAAGLLYFFAGVVMFFLRSFPGKAVDELEYPQNQNKTTQFEEQPHVEAVEEATHQDEYALDDVELATHSAGDGVSDAEEIKPQIY